MHFLCMNSWALVTQVTNVQNIDNKSNLAMNLCSELQTGQIRICPSKIGPETSNLALASDIQQGTKINCSQNY